MNQLDTIMQQINRALDKIEADNPAEIIKSLQERNNELEQLLAEATTKIDSYIQALNDIIQNSEPQQQHEENKKIAVNE